MFDYSYENLRRITQTEKGKQIIEQAKVIYEEEYSDKPILALNYTHQKRYIIDGNRRTFEKAYFARRDRLRLLQLLAIADDRYIEPLEEIMAAITDEFTWVLPAHAYLPDEKVYDYRYKLDLFSTETSFYLSETVYVFGDKLSADIRKRVALAVEDKIIRVYEYEKRKLFHSFEHNADNWAAVCACGIGLSYLYLFPERFPCVEEKILKNLELYLSSIDEEGYCDEGISYWQYGFGFFSLFYDVYVQLTGKKPAVLETSKVKNLVQYMKRSQMNGKVYLPFADGGTKSFVGDVPVFCAIKNLFGDLFDVDFYSEIKCLKGKTRILDLRLLNGLDKFTGSNVGETETAGTYYYHQAQVFTYKNRNYAFAVKCGHNGEKHNHNDVGTFQIVKNGKRLICDIGAGEYTRQYFDLETRYTFFPCSSLGHSVPIVGGKAQSVGKEYHGTVLKQKDDLFVIDLAPAYDGGVESLVMTCEPREKGVRIHYKAKGLTGEKITFRFVSDFKPILSADGTTLRIDDLLHVKNAQGVVPEIAEQIYKGPSSSEKKRVDGTGITNEETAYTIDFTVNGTDVEVEFYFES